MHENKQGPEKAILIAVGKKSSDRNIVFEQLDELENLANTAGAEIIEKIYQELEFPNPATAIGKGKVEEIKQLMEDEHIQLVIFDDELTPSQLKNLENELKVKIMDRSSLILDIFSKHAKTIEAKTQVELAQYQYLLPRLSRMWTHLSKQFGGVGTKGPGETQIETDRRAIRNRIKLLKEKLEQIAVQRHEQQKNRSNFPRFAFVGYTNAGKSSLMNLITKADVLVENKLFATLDTTVRSYRFESGKKILISDTVGFIRKLPAHLVASFRSTLSEAVNSDVLLHVVDVSHPQFHEHIATVNETLEQLKISKKETILILNKIDLLEDISIIKSLEAEFPNSIAISAKRGININKLLETMESKIR